MGRLPCESCEARKDFAAYKSDRPSKRTERASRIITGICGEALPQQVREFLENRDTMAEGFEQGVSDCPGAKRVRTALHKLTMLVTGDHDLDMQAATCENPFLQTDEYNQAAYETRPFVIEARHQQLTEL